MRLIELTGLPGSGKSTILPIMKKYLRTSGYEIYDRQRLILRCKEFPLNGSLSTAFLRFFPITLRDKMLTLLYRILDNKQTYIAQYMLDNWKFYEAVMNNISDSPLPSYQKHWLVLWWLDAISSYQMGLESLDENSIMILEEGFYHKVINFYVHLNHNLEYSKIQSYVNNIPKIDILIHIETNLDTCLARLKNRNLPRVIRGSTVHAVRKYLENSRKAIEYSQNIISNKGTKIIQIENSTSPFSRRSITEQLSKNLENFGKR